jgi:nucleoside 2-deoxyribosyltransferase
MKIYLAGKMSGLTFEEMTEWRNEILQKLYQAAQLSDTKINVIHPVMYYNFVEKRHQSEIEVEEYDLAHVVSSNIIVVNLAGLNDSIGTIIELHDAHYHHRIPVIAFGDRELYGNLHTWIQNDITRVENNIDDVVDYIRDFYFI